MSIFKNIMGKIFPHAAAPTPATASMPAAPSAPAAAPQSVDVGAVLTEMAKKKTETLNWRTSIVDLLKVLDLDSSLTARRALADELHFTGDKNDTAAMNIWLHAEVMKKVAENGGVVPKEMKAA